ncbi:MAG: S8 family serine peptidase [Bacteroidota bacterium]
MASKKVNQASFSYGGTQINFTKSKTQAAVRYMPGMKPASKNKSNSKEEDQEQLRDFQILNMKTGIDDKLDELRGNPDVSVGTHVWHIDGEDDTPFVPTGYLYVEFLPGTDNNLELALFDELNLNIREVVGPDAYRVCTTPESPNPIKCVMFLQKNKIVAVAEPEFVTRPVTNWFAAPAGRFISTQWHLENTGAQIPVIELDNSIYSSMHFKRGADAKVKEAWAFLQSVGSSNLKIAIIDTGFDTSHPQLRGDGTKIRNAFNAVNRGSDVSPWFQAQDGSMGVFSHGTSCASVAAGAVDSQGVVGAAPNSRLIPIKLDVLSDDAIVKAFEHALLNGADIITCSLGFPKPVPLSTWVSNTISKVARQGRNGLGMPIFIAAGNANPASNNEPRPISDFATHPEVMCITASNSLDEQSSYSFYGANAFMCAPTNGNSGVGITTATVTVAADGRTLAHEYTSNFGGTSSATPLAAGICALVITANPNITLQQIRNVLGSTTDKIGGSGYYDSRGHSEKLGYGRINALCAVQAARQLAGSATTNTDDNTNSGGTDTGDGDTPPPASNVLRGKVTNTFLNVRSGPSTANAIVAKLNQGDIVPLLEKLTGWWRIGDGQFVSADYITVLPSAGAPVATRKAKVINPTLNVRNSPSTAGAKVGELKLGDIITIYQTSADGWHRIGNNMWVLGKYVQEV